MSSEKKPKYNPKNESEEIPAVHWKRKIHDVIFGYESTAGKTFDVLLIVAILLSIAVVMLESVEWIYDEWGSQLRAIEWVLTGLFTVEYVLRIICVVRPKAYALSFFGIVDLLSILPTYLGLFFGSSSSLSIIRVFRLLRIFRVLKLVNYLKEADQLWAALKSTRRKITVFLFVVMSLVLILGSLMYIIEGPENGFTSIPKSVYWAIVTLTTVGYGDIAPKTVLGQALAATSMILGYSLIIVPTGVFSVEMATARLDAKELREKEAKAKAEPVIICPTCEKTGHDSDALFCKYCGTEV